jgi:uncharacterized protein (TIGR00290 family)
MEKEKVVFCWSGGKDSTSALHRLLQTNKYEVCFLFTTVNEHYKRVTMHGVREELLKLQAESIGIPLHIMYLSENPDNNEYEQQMEKTLLEFKSQGIDTVVFGDIYLEDLRRYRDENVAKVGMKTLYPLWKEKPQDLINEFIELGYKTITCCVNDAFLGEDMVGRIIDKQFIAELPANVDVCGENGEFHTFVFSGFIFKKEISIKIGEKLYKPLEIKTDCTNETKGFWYVDLLIKQ